MEPTELDLRSYLAALRRRARLFAWVAGLIIAVGVLFAALLPAIYQSRAVILIEQQEIPSELVPSTVTSFADQRIQVISQRVMTSENLLEIMDKYDLYEVEREREPREVVLDQMREDIGRDMISAEVVDPRSGRPTEATIAFSLSYRNESPLLAQRVTSELVSLYLEENIKNRTEAATETSSFLSTEAARMRTRVVELEGKFAQFKTENVENRPELERVIRDGLNRAELELAEVDRRIHAAIQQRIYLEAELAQIEPFRTVETKGIVTPTEQLNSIESALTAAEAAYGDRHPDVIKLRKQAQALRAEVSPREAREILERQLAEHRTALAEVAEKYAGDHPDVRAASRAVSGIEAKLAALPVETTPQTPNNPAYIGVAARIEGVTAEVETMREKSALLREKIESMQMNLSRIPEVEAEFRALEREYETARREYEQISAKQTQANLSKNLESERKGEKFTLIEPPLSPEQPASPNRTMILIASLILGLLGGLGSAAVAETLDNRVRGRRGVQEILTNPPLASIPIVLTGDEPRRHVRRRLAYGAVATAAVVAGLVLIHLAYKPLDVAWFILLRKFGI